MSRAVACLGACLGALALAAGCSQTDNDRPATLPYITLAILQPSCSQYVCHSSYTRAKGYAFDTIEAARASLRPIVSKNDPTASLLYTVLTRTVKRMPFDSPLPDKDIDLIMRWLEENAVADLGL
jgi:hypothetical protein